MPGAVCRRDRFLFTKSASLPILLIPAAIGLLLHAPLYFPVKKIIQQKTKDTVFYDSVMFAVLVITYPRLLAAAEHHTSTPDRQ